MKLSFALVAVLACQVLAAPSKDSSILKTLKTKPSATVIVSVAGNNVAALTNSIKTRTFSTRSARLNNLYHTLKTHADSTQANILNFLNKQKSEKPIFVDQLWVTNEIIVKGADYEIVKQLLTMDEVTAVRESRVFPLKQPVEIIVHPNGTVPHAGEQWGVLDVEAVAVHATGNRGGNAVIGTIDTGVRVTHVALAEGFRGTYAWYDPYQGTVTPNDQNGQGTQAMGIIAGRANGIGVAPEATWISCKGCSTSRCTEDALLRCGQFMTCPTNAQGGSPDCSQAPNAVSNNWGGGQGDNWYDQIMSAWIAADIAPVFAMGISGPDCGSADSPGDSELAIAVGATTEDKSIAYYSSVGPTYIGNRIKPDISAPGSNVVTSHYLYDTSYTTQSGTAFASAHVAGLAALLYTDNPNMTVAELRAALISGAQPVNPSGDNCGDIDEGTYPNNHAGAGRINARESLNIA